MPTRTNDVLAPADDATTAVLVHLLLNTLSVIGSTSRTLLERWDQLPRARREQLLALIHDSVAVGIDRLHLMSHARPVVPENASRIAG